MDMTLWVHPNPEGGWYSYSTHYSKGAVKVKGLVKTGIARYQNHGGGEGISLEAVVDTEYGKLSVPVCRVYGRRNTDYFWKSEDNILTEQAEKAFRKIRKVFGSKRAEMLVVPGALYGEIAEATWALHPGEIEIAEHLIEEAQT